MSSSTVNYDVFLSYAHVDGAHAQQLDAWLREQDLRTFFDRRELRAGLRWVDALEEAIGNSGAVAILVGQHGLGNTQQYERQLALVRQTQDRDFPVIPVLLPGCDKPPTGFLELLTWVDLRYGIGIHDQPGGLQSLLSAIRHELVASAAIRGSICPYMGLEPFREEDAAFFCGRNETIDNLVQQVREHPFVAVVGPSGIGKSSLVFAGLLPALRRQRDTTVWDVVTLRPTSLPLHALAQAFNPYPRELGVFALQEWLSNEAAVLRNGSPDKLAPVIAQRLDSAPEKPDRLLVYVDQWEELYSMGPGPEAPQERRRQHLQDVERFIALLLGAASDEPARTSVVLTVRADFYGPLMAHSAVSALLPRQQVNIGRMPREALRASIVTPAEKVGLAFHPPNLVSQILEDAGEDEGTLPLIEYALKETWVNREGNRLTADGYSKAGRVQGAIQVTAERTYNALTTNEQHAAKRLFLGLVHPGEGREDMRARIAMPDDPALLAVAAKFTDLKARLLVAGWEKVPPEAGAPPSSTAASADTARGRAVLEVAHEALIRNWSTLRSWLDANRERMRARAAILQQQKDWQTNNYSEDLLLPTGFYLERGRNLLNDPGDVPVQDIAHFINTSIGKEDRRLTEEREKALAAERKIIAEKLHLEAWLNRIEVARRKQRPGDILVLAEEAPNSAREFEALRTAAHALTQLGRPLYALNVLQRARQLDPDDVKARQIEGIALGRAQRYAEAREALRRLAEEQKDGENLGLLARTWKDEWAQNWNTHPQRKLDPLAAACDTAGTLQSAASAYVEAFRAAPGDYYPGINALTLGRLWEHVTGRKSRLPLSLTAAGVGWAASAAVERRDKDLYWALTTRAELALIEDRKADAIDDYSEAVALAVADRDWFALDSSSQQLDFLRELKFHDEIVADAADVIDRAEQQLRPLLGSRPDQRVEPAHVVVFSGHMADNPAVRGLGEERPSRLPPAKIEAAAASIRVALDEVGADAGDLGLCGGASGSDLLFAEACLARGMRVELRLARAENEFLAESVTFADPDRRWERSFAQVRESPAATVLVMPDELGPASEGVNVHHRCNRWMVYTALSQGPLRTYLVTVWDGGPDDGPEGTKNMVELVRKLTGRQPIIIDPATLPAAL
jgi:tetratricopeptide (TPR) repeat protein